MAAVARKVAPKKKKRIAQKPMVRQSAVPKVAPAVSAKTTGSVAVAKGRAVSRTRATVEEIEKPLSPPTSRPKAPTTAKKTTKRRKEKSTIAKAKPQEAKTQKSLALAVIMPPSRSKTKGAEGPVKAPRKTKKRRQKTTAKRKVEVTTVVASSSKTATAGGTRTGGTRTGGTRTSKATNGQALDTSRRAGKAKAESVNTTVKARRVRAPKDLAAQYGETEKKVSKRRMAESAETKRARRDAALRQKMREAMEVGDDLIARLRRAGMIAGGDEPEAKNGHNGHSTKRIIGSRVLRRPRKWEARCGKCGGKSLFKTAAGLCAKCGAIMVREN